MISYRKEKRMNKTLIIAELSGNHRQSFDVAKDIKQKGEDYLYLKLSSFRIALC